MNLLFALLFLFSRPCFAVKAIMEGITATNSTIFVDTTNTNVAIASATINKSGYFYFTGNSALGGASTNNADTRFYHAAEGRIVLESLAPSQITAFDIYPTTSTKPTNEGLAEVTIHGCDSKTCTATVFKQNSFGVLPEALGGEYFESMESSGTLLIRNRTFRHESSGCQSWDGVTCVPAGQEIYLNFQSTPTTVATGNFSWPIDFTRSHIQFSNDNQIGANSDYYHGRRSGLISNVPTGSLFSWTVNGSTIVQITSTAETLSSGVSLALSGSAGFISGGSSVTASAFFGNGANLKDITPGNVGGAWSTWVPAFTGFSVDPTVSIARYIQIGKFVMATVLFSANGTSNATTYTMTLPVAAKNANVAVGVMQAADNGANQTIPCRIDSRGASTTADVYKDMSAAAWTNSGGKGCVGNIIYEAN